MRYKFSKAEAARLDRWTRVGYAKQVIGRAGTKGSLHEVWTCAQRRFDVLLHEEEGACEISQGMHQVLLHILWCSQ